MVWIVRPESVREYEVFDTGGRRLGRVVEPVEPPAMGVGAATIMLDRRAEGAPSRS